MVHQKLCQLRRKIPRDKRIETDPDINIGLAGKAGQQGEAAQIPIAIIVPLIRPDAVGD